MCWFVQHVGLGEYAELFTQHEIGRPMLELLDEDRSIWPELFAADLSTVRHCACASHWNCRLSGLLDGRIVAPRSATTCARN